jgi:hypothetical protein
MVLVAKGIHATILAAKESVWGTYVAPTKSLGLVQSFGTDLDGSVTESFALGQAKSVSVDAGNVKPGGSVEVLMSNGRMLEYAVFGGASTNVDTGTDCTHTFVYANDLPSFSIEESYLEPSATNLVKKWKGIFFKNTTLGVSLDEYLKLKSDFVAKDIDVSSTSVTNPSIGTTGALKGYQVTLELGGSQVPYAQNWEITINRNSAIGHSIGSRVPSHAGSNIINIDWKATIGFNSVAEYTRFLGQNSGILPGSPTNFLARFKGNNGVTLGSGRLEIDMQLASSRTKALKQTADLGDFVMYDITGSGQLSTTTFVDQVLAADW